MTDRLEGAGYRKAKDLLAYLIASDFDAPRIMTRLAEKATHQVRVRRLRRKRLKQELEVLRDIFNDAWFNNWGFVPFTEAEFADVGELLTLLVDDDFVQIAEINDRPVAMIVVLPNINKIIRDLTASCCRSLAQAAVAPEGPLSNHRPVRLMGVRREYRRLAGSGMAFMVINAARRGWCDAASARSNRPGYLKTMTTCATFSKPLAERRTSVTACMKKPLTEPCQTRPAKTLYRDYPGRRSRPRRPASGARQRLLQGHGRDRRNPMILRVLAALTTPHVGRSLLSGPGRGKMSRRLPADRLLDEGTVDWCEPQPTPSTSANSACRMSPPTRPCRSPPPTTPC